MMSKFLLPAILSYLVGSIPFSFLTAKYFGGIDIRNYGSGNTGATNVFRTLGKKSGALAFVGDFLKGFIVTLLVKIFIGMDVAVVCAALAVIGHCYPIFLRFKGGKGVATTAGTIFALYPLIGFILFTTGILIIVLSRIVSLASISASLMFPIISLLFSTHEYFIIYSIALSLLVIYRHKSNISRLITGSESKISFK